jgi:hypothetical protein
MVRVLAVLLLISSHTGLHEKKLPHWRRCPNLLNPYSHEDTHHYRPELIRLSLPSPHRHYSKSLVTRMNQWLCG